MPEGQDKGWTRYFSAQEAAATGQGLEDLKEALAWLADDFPGTAGLALPLRALVKLELRRNELLHMDDEEAAYHQLNDSVLCPAFDHPAGRQQPEYAGIDDGIPVATGWQHCEVCGTRYFKHPDGAWIPAPGILVQFSAGPGSEPELGRVELVSSTGRGDQVVVQRVDAAGKPHGELATRPVSVLKPLLALPRQAPVIGCAITPGTGPVTEEDREWFRAQGCPD